MVSSALSHVGSASVQNVPELCKTMQCLPLTQVKPLGFLWSRSVHSAPAESVEQDIDPREISFVKTGFHSIDQVSLQLTM